MPYLIAVVPYDLALRIKRKRVCSAERTNAFTMTLAMRAGYALPAGVTWSVEK